MSEKEQKQIFQKNLLKYISSSGKNQKEIADAIGVSPQTFNTWCQGIALPRMGKVQLLADYFHINKSDLIEDKTEEPQTLAAYFDGNEYTEDELEEIKQFAAFVKSKRKPLKTTKPVLNAAHARTDIEVTAADQQHDDDIMDDENF